MMFMCAVLVKKGGFKCAVFSTPQKFITYVRVSTFKPRHLLHGCKPEVKIPEVKICNKRINNMILCFAPVYRILLQTVSSATGFPGLEFVDPFPEFNKSEVNIMCAGIDDDEKNGVALDEIFDENDAVFCYFLKI